MGLTARPSGCKGYDTFSPFKLAGGIAKSCPDARDLENVQTFFRKMKDCLR
ncbi:flavodoxin [Oscillibacter sp. CAG:155]|nr:flavodoxin [Oscillibacter sp. CAG:155]